MTVDPEVEKYIKRWKNDWNAFAYERLGVRLDNKQQEILNDVQHNKRISVKSGHSRGKDFTSAVAASCFLNLKVPSKVILTAPTGRQVYSIMMSEIKSIYSHSRSMPIQPLIPLSGEILSGMIKMKRPDHFLIGFKAGDKATEAWTGFHSPNLMVVATEASGIADETFNAIEGLLTGDSKLLLIYNPNKTTGNAFRSSRSKHYVKHTLSCLDAPNVVAKKNIIPGQVDYNWVKDHIDMWCQPIQKEEMQSEFYDFEFEGECYRPDNLFRVKVLGEFPSEGDDQLIPLAWVEESNQRWLESKAPKEPKIIGADIAGMGRDKTVFAIRRKAFIDKLKVFATLDHMDAAGKLKNMLVAVDDVVKIDTIGEGAGVHSRMQELEENSISAKFSESGKGLTDLTGEREFANMRAYCYWAIRDALDPKLDGTLCLPPDDELAEELTSITWSNLSNGSILLEKKEDIIERLGRSPDKADAVALTYYPQESGRMNSLFTTQSRE